MNHPATTASNINVSFISQLLWVKLTENGNHSLTVEPEKWIWLQKNVCTGAGAWDMKFGKKSRATAKYSNSADIGGLKDVF
jgi:hypothetical protein